VGNKHGVNTVVEDPEKRWRTNIVATPNPEEPERQEVKARSEIPWQRSGINGLSPNRRGGRARIKEREVNEEFLKAMSKNKGGQDWGVGMRTQNPREAARLGTQGGKLKQ